MPDNRRQRSIADGRGNKRSARPGDSRPPSQRARGGTVGSATRKVDLLGDVADLSDQNERRLAILKALGDDTRFMVFQEIARSSVPLATSEVAGKLCLHVNTVRPHLERMVDVGLLNVETGGQGDVGRPQHRYSVSPGAPKVGYGEPAYSALARGLLTALMDAGVDSEMLVEAGRVIGREGASRTSPVIGVLGTLMSEQNRYGFDPYPGESSTLDSNHDECEMNDPGCRTVQFRCPFPDLAAINPDLVCGFHRGMVEGLIEQRSGGKVHTTFSTILDEPPCRVELAAR